MKSLACLVHVVLMVAALAHVSVGARAGISISDGETITVTMCTAHGSSTRQIVIGGGDTQQDASTACCDHCSVTFPPPLAPSAHSPVQPGWQAFNAAHAPRIHPRSPHWPGAPAIGPPLVSHPL